MSKPESKGISRKPLGPVAAAACVLAACSSARERQTPTPDASTAQIFLSRQALAESFSCLDSTPYDPRQAKVVYREYPSSAKAKVINTTTIIESGGSSITFIAITDPSRGLAPIPGNNTDYLKSIGCTVATSLGKKIPAATPDMVDYSLPKEFECLADGAIMSNFIPTAAEPDKYFGDGSSLCE